MAVAPRRSLCTPCSASTSYRRARCRRRRRQATAQGRHRDLRILVAPDGDLVHVHLDGTTFTLRYVDPVQRYGSHAGGGADDIAEAPMPGVVIAVHVKEGQPFVPATR